MMVRAEYVADGILSYAEAEILPALDGWRMWAASAALMLMRENAVKMAQTFAADKGLAALGLIDAQGMVNVDGAVAALKETAKKHGKLKLNIPQVGEILLGESDFDTLHDYINKAAE